MPPANKTAEQIADEDESSPLDPRLRALVRVVLFAAIAFLIWLPRGQDLDRLVTPDEPLWLARSANFVKGLADGNLDQTYQYAHPGVTVMWAGTVGYLLHAPDYIDDGPASIRQNTNRIAEELIALGLSPIETLAATRQAIVILISAVLTLCAWYAVRLFGLAAGLIGAAILASDPFHVALSRLLHLDGLASSLFGLAALVWLVYLFDGRRRRDLIVTGIVVGLAGLTRTLAIVLLPMILISAFVEAPTGGESARLDWRGIWARMRPVVALGAIALVTFVALWPAMWSSPIDTTRTFVRVGFELGQTAHARPIFFDGNIYSGKDPGLLFYPVSFLWRTTPAMLIGLALAALLLLSGLRAREWLSKMRPTVYLLVLALTILIVLDMSDKKLDRYIIAIMPPLAFVAGWGVAGAARWIVRHRSRFVASAGGAIAVGVAALLLVINVAAIVRDHPYGLSYYNPMLGGAEEAKATMMIGWGEGLDQIGAAVEQQPGVEDARVITSVWRIPLTYFVDTTPIVAYEFMADDALVEWLRADYYVWYITPDQRGYIPPEMQVFFASQAPVTTVRLSGITYAALYDLRQAPLPDYVVQRAWMAPIAPGLQLVTATLSAEPLLPGDEVTALFYLTGTPAGAGRVEVQLSLTAPDGSVISGEPQSVPVEEGQTVWSVRRRIELPPAAALGTYWVSARFTAGGAAYDVTLGSVTVQSELAPTTTPEPADAEAEDVEG